MSFTESEPFLPGAAGAQRPSPESRAARLGAWPVGLALVLLGGCSGAPRPPQAPVAPTTVPPLATPSAAPAPSGVPVPTPTPAPAQTGAGGVPVAPREPARAAPPRYVKLGPPITARNWSEVSLQAAKRLVAAHPDTTYMSQPPEPLLAIPVLEVELHGDGSVRQVKVLRVPSQARDTTQLAIDAVHRAAPYGDVTRLSKPWRFVEVFLFDEQRRFKPRTLDQ